MQATTEIILGVGAAVVGVCAWLFRLEGRVNTHDVEHRQHRTNHDAIKSDLAYIRERIDSALNGKTHL